MATAGYSVGAGAADQPETDPGEGSSAVVSATDATEAVAEATRENRPHVAALADIVALAVLGGSLVARNRLAGGQRRRSPPTREEVVTDHERVRRLIDDNGGRMRQTEIVEEVEWSKAKVSRLLADLDADEEITKLRLGRENLICLPGHEPRASRPAYAGDRQARSR